MKKVFLVIVASIAVGLMYLGADQYNQYQIVEALRPPVKNVSLRVANAARYETEKGAKITFKELFETLESDVSEIDKRILEVQTAALPSNARITEPVLEYLRRSQELLRAWSLKLRKLLAVSAASDRYERALQDLRTSDRYRYEFAEKLANRALDDLKRAVEEHNDAVPEVVTATNGLREAYLKIAVVLPADSLIEPAILDAIQKHNEAEMRASASDAKVN